MYWNIDIMSFLFLDVVLCCLVSLLHFLLLPMVVFVFLIILLGLFGFGVFFFVGGLFLGSLRPMYLMGYGLSIFKIV